MKISNLKLKQIIVEEITSSDRREIKDLIEKELQKQLRSVKVKDLIQDEVKKLLATKETKAELGEISKKVLKKLYKDLSIQHPYIIDRIKV
jgi:hypothetical protein